MIAIGRLVVDAHSQVTASQKRVQLCFVLLVVRVSGLALTKHFL